MRIKNPTQSDRLQRTPLIRTIIPIDSPMEPPSVIARALTTPHRTRGTCPKAMTLSAVDQALGWRAIPSKPHKGINEKDADQAVTKRSKPGVQVLGPRKLLDRLDAQAAAFSPTSRSEPSAGCSAQSRRCSGVSIVSVHICSFATRCRLASGPPCS